MTHYAIDAGHNSAPADTGATGIKFEDDLTRALGAKVSVLLVAAGHQVTECFEPRSDTLIDSLRGRVKRSNDANADYFISLHFNKFLDGDQVTPNPMGAEIFAISPTGKAMAAKVLPKILSLGFRDRGVKSARLHVIVETDAPAILIESCFLDSVADMAILDKVGLDKLAIKIVEGLLEF
jgi:N-acetylmuramoyl-L-alanine amidase